MRWGWAILALIIFIVATPGWASAESSSTNFIMWAETEAAGGDRSTSTNFIQYGSLGDFAGQKATSSGFQMHVGFEALYEEPRITMSVTGTSVTFSPNPLTTGSVSTGSSTITVSTNADFGYSLTVRELVDFANATPTPLSSVADGTVTAGSEEWGVAVSGSDAAFGDDRSVTSTPRVIATKPTWGADRVTTVTYKAAISNTTAAGSYSGSVVYIATANF